MASKAPPIPPEQRSHRGQQPDVEGRHADRRDQRTGDQSGQPGDSDINLHQQGQQGNTWQNTHHQGHQQDR